MISSEKKSGSCDPTCQMHKILEKLSIEEQRTLARLLNNWKERDQRRHSRIGCSIITEYRFLNRSYRDTIKNISLGGAFIESANRFPVDQEIRQHFFFPNFEIPIRSKSKIMWTSGAGFGVQFEFVEERS
jgi:hypothetical protein